MMKIQRFFLLTCALILLSGCSEESPQESQPVEVPIYYDRDFDYLTILKNSPGYAYESADDLPVFTYQDSTDSNLTMLRENYQLRAVAGNGNDLSQMINLLKWVHRKIRHDGNNHLEQDQHSLGILGYCDSTGNAVNCIMMAIVLNDVFLSMGFRSRVIHGNSKHYIFFGEWHAFNTVYVHSLQKWIYIDPTFQSCYTNDQGQYLSIAEIREYLIQDREVFLYPQADYNGEPISREDNLHYLSKNFYRFSCSLHSGFGLNGFGYTDEIISFTYVHLDPQGEQQYGLFWADDYFTSNPDYFWQEPAN